MHILYSSNRKKVKRIDKNREEITKNVFYRLKIFDSARFMASSLSNLFNNRSQVIHKIKYKTDAMIKYVKLGELNVSILTVFFGYTNFKDGLIEYKCLCCNKNYQQMFYEKLTEHIFNRYKFSNHDNNQFILFFL